MTFDVIDPKTGEYPDLEHIAKTEEWAQNLIPCDMEGFCINEDGKNAGITHTVRRIDFK